MASFTGAELVEAIDLMARTNTEQANETMMSDLANLASTNLGLPLSDIPDIVVEALAQPSGSKKDRELEIALKSTGINTKFNDATFETHLVTLLRESADIRRFHSQARNQASFVKTVLRPLDGLWLKRWSAEREGFPVETVFEKSFHLNTKQIENAQDLEDWSNEVWALFKFAAVEGEETRTSLNKRPRGTVSLSGIRAYSGAWERFMTDLKRTLSDPSAIETIIKSNPNRKPFIPPTPAATLDNRTSFQANTKSTALDDFAQKSTEPQLSHNNETFTITIKPNDSELPSVTSQWSLIDKDFQTKFDNWIKKMTLLMDVQDIGFSGEIRSESNSNSQSLNLKDSSVAQFSKWLNSLKD